MAQPLALGELAALLHAANPAALLIPARFVRRAIRLDCSLPGLGLQVPHHKTYVLQTALVREAVRLDEFPAVHAAHLPEKLLLISAPSPERLGRTPRNVALVKFWRRLFHASVDAELGRGDDCKLSRAAARQRVAVIGQAAFDEIRAVLKHERYLPPTDDDRTTYAEFAAVFLELRRFAPRLVHRYFPSLYDEDAIERLIAQDVDGDKLFASTRLKGAPPPRLSYEPEVKHDDGFDPWEHPLLAAGRPLPLRSRYYRLQGRLARKLGNDARAAVCYARAAKAAPEGGEALRRGAEQSLENLAGRLTHALAVDDADAHAVARLLSGLLPAAASGFWSQSARLLYDLQKACVDVEKEVYTSDFWGWLFSFGRRPMRRSLPLLRETLAVRHLKSALARLTRVDVPASLREELAHLLHTAASAAERRLRMDLEPIVVKTLTESGFRPRSATERVAFDRMVGELLDRVAGHGRLSFGELRDVVSRSHLKLADMQGVGEFVFGDSLLRADRAFGRALDGVYREGEIYLRWLTRFTSLAYGTAVGRFVTRYLALPFGGSFLILEGLQHTLLVVVQKLLRMKDHFHITNTTTILALGAFLFACMHLPGFARTTWKAAKTGWTWTKRIVFDWPLAVLQLPAIRRFVHSAAFVSVRRLLILPTLATLVVLKLGPVAAAGLTEALWPDQDRAILWPEHTRRLTAVVFAIAALLFLSPLGRRIEAYLMDRFFWIWERVRVDLIPGLVRMIVDFFRMIMEGVERMLYSVDQWLRFRTGVSPLAFAFKTAVGAVWAIVEYVLRCAVNLVVEPQVNPIKHFPVVTVSHKIMIPFYPGAVQLMTPALGQAAAAAVGGVVLFSLPGVCGFLAWELLSNWLLYAANRPQRLQAVRIGSHGETMLRFLRVGFHSGTVPKLYARLRRVERAALAGGDRTRPLRLHEELHHVAESVELFVARELLRVLRETPAWRDVEMRVAHVGLSSKRIAVDLACPSLGTPGDHVEIVFEEQSDLLTVRTEEIGWLAQATDEQRAIWRAALAGFYKMCGVHIVREQLEIVLATLADRPLDYDVADRGLVVWTKDSGEPEFVYDLHLEGRWSPAKTLAGEACNRPPLDLDAVMFDRSPILYADWERLWQEPEQVHLRPLLPEIRMLPAGFELADAVVARTQPV